MRFDLSNASASFQRYINKIFTRKLIIFVIVYFDNILIYIKDLGYIYMDIIYWVLKQFQKYSFFTNLKKYGFY